MEEKNEPTQLIVIKQAIKIPLKGAFLFLVTDPLKYI